MNKILSVLYISGVIFIALIATPFIVAWCLVDAARCR